MSDQKLPCPDDRCNRFGVHQADCPNGGVRTLDISGLRAGSIDDLGSRATMIEEEKDG
jgi:hypothetical protein